MSVKKIMEHFNFNETLFLHLIVLSIINRAHTASSSPKNIVESMNGAVVKSQWQMERVFLA